MKLPLLIIVFAQILFTSGDLLARYCMPKYGFTPAAFLSGWFALYFLLRTVAMFGQLYVFTAIELGRSMAFFGAVSIMLSNILGLFVLRETLSPGAYIGVSLAIIAYIVLALS
jgi:uncharacterized membrane protein